MDSYEGGTVLINRNEARMFKRAAAFNNEPELSKVYGHYLAVRKVSHVGREALKYKGREESEFMAEANRLPELIVRPEGSHAIIDMRYVYGPRLAAAAVRSLVTAVDDNLFRPWEVEAAQQIIDDYAALESVHTTN